MRLCEHFRMEPRRALPTWFARECACRARPGRGTLQQALDRWG